MDITAVLKAYLYRLRQVEPNARRLRALAHFLRKNPDYQPPEALSLQALPAWSSRFAGLRLKTHPDLAFSSTRDALADMARGIAAAKVSITRQRLAGRPADGGTNKAVRLLAPKPVQQAFARYLRAASAATAPLSALGWKRGQRDFDALDDGAWLLYVLHGVDMLGKTGKGRLPPLQVQRQEAPASHGRSGNIMVTDLALWKKD